MATIPLQQVLLYDRMKVMKETIKGISAILWLLIIGPIVSLSLFDVIKASSEEFWTELFGGIISVGIYFVVLYFLMIWAEKK